MLKKTLKNKHFNIKKVKKTTKTHKNKSKKTNRSFIKQKKPRLMTP